MSAEPVRQLSNYKMTAGKAGVNKGFTLIEVLISMAFIALIYGFVVSIFFQGFSTISRGEIEDQGVILANNEMKRLSSYENPLYIYFMYGLGGAGAILVDKLKNGDILPYELVTDGTIMLGEKYNISSQTADSNADIKAVTTSKASYTRTVDLTFDDVTPVLIHLWVKVKWTDPQQQFPDGEYELETRLAQ